MAHDEDIWLVYSTFPTHEKALYAARRLLDERVIACANIHDGVRSLYRWEGKICEENETVLTAKTSQHALARAMEMLKQLHPYELPCIVAYPLTEGYPPFLQWVKDETR